MLNYYEPILNMSDPEHYSTRPTSRPVKKLTRPFLTFKMPKVSLNISFKEIIYIPFLLL